MGNYNYSIIIPHKNTPILLQRCLDSIPERQDIQIIIVDDNSDPHLVDFKNFPGSNRNNTEIYFTKEGKGAGFARNVGLKQAKGKWILFADADDYYNPNAFSTLDSYINTNYDIIYYFANSVDSKTGLKSQREKDLEKFYKKYQPNNIRSTDYIRFKNWVPWNKMIRYSFWKKHTIYFDEIPFGNDLNFSLKLSFLAREFHIDTSRIYCLTYSNNSITYTRRSYEKEALSIILRAQLNVYFRKIKRPLWHQFLFIYILQTFHRKGLKYTLGYISFLIYHGILIIKKIKRKKQEIKDFLSLHNK